MAEETLIIIITVLVIITGGKLNAKKRYGECRFRRTYRLR